MNVYFYLSLEWWKLCNIQKYKGKEVLNATL